MGTVPMGTGELRMIHSRVSWMFFPVERSITVSAPQRVAQRSFSTSSSMEDETAEFPMLALIFTLNARPMIIGSSSGWLMLAGMMARPRATSSRTKAGALPSPRAPHSIPGRPPPPADPPPARLGHAQAHVAAQRAAGVVDAQGRLAAGEGDLAHRHPDAVVP